VDVGIAMIGFVVVVGTIVGVAVVVVAVVVVIAVVAEDGVGVVAVGLDSLVAFEVGVA